MLLDTNVLFLCDQLYRQMCKYSMWSGLFVYVSFNMMYKNHPINIE